MLSITAIQPLGWCEVRLQSVGAVRCCICPGRKSEKVSLSPVTRDCTLRRFRDCSVSVTVGYFRVFPWTQDTVSLSHSPHMVNSGLTRVITLPESSKASISLSCNPDRQSCQSCALGSQTGGYIIKAPHITFSSVGSGHEFLSPGTVSCQIASLAAGKAAPSLPVL